MNNSRKRNGPGHHTEAIAQIEIPAVPTQESDAHKGTAQGGQMASVAAEVIERDQRRKYPATIVRSCPCGAQHMHRGLGIRHAPCGETYLVVAA